jgi:RraA family protein
MVTKPQSAKLHPGPGFRIRADFARPRPDLVQEFRRFTIPDISDHLNRLYALDPAITCLTERYHSLCGTACTVRVFPGDNLMVHKALDIAEPGDVVVIAAGGTLSNAVLGGMVCAKAKHRGIAGFVVDGLVRDQPEILELDFPVLARGVTPVGPLHRGPGEINFPVACGGVVVNPGDIILADVSGTVVVPRAVAAELLGRLRLFEEVNAGYVAAVQSGEFSNVWVDDILRQQGCPLIVGDCRAEDDGAAAPRRVRGSHV